MELETDDGGRAQLQARVPAGVAAANGRTMRPVGASASLTLLLR